jgi:hypothetical protein
MIIPIAKRAEDVKDRSSLWQIGNFLKLYYDDKIKRFLRNENDSISEA